MVKISTSITSVIYYIIDLYLDFSSSLCGVGMPLVSPAILSHSSAIEAFAGFARIHLCSAAEK